MMKKNELIMKLSERAEKLEKDDLIKVGNFIDGLIERKKEDDGIDKDTLLALLNVKGFQDPKSFAKHLYSHNKSNMTRNQFTELVIYHLECSTLQAESIKKMLIMLGYMHNYWNGLAIEKIEE